MDEILQKLLEAEVLTDETKKQLEEAFEKQLNAVIEETKEQVEKDVRAELVEQWVEEKEQLVEAIDTKVTDFLAAELEELKEDIERFRDLEVEYAERLTEAKAAMADELKNDMKELVENLDKFLEIRLAAEFEELKEDIEEVRKIEFGRKIVETFAQEFMENFYDEDSAQVSLREAMQRIEKLEEALNETQKEKHELERQMKLDELLAPLSDRQREVMEAILRNVETEKLEEAYSSYIGRVLKETSEAHVSEKENKVPAEKKAIVTENVDDDKNEDKKSSGIVVEGDKEEVTNIINEGDSKSLKIDELKILAGIK